MSLKLFLLAVIFVITGGSLFADLFRRRPLLLVLAISVSTLSAFYLGRSIVEDIREDLRSDLLQESEALLDRTPEATSRSAQSKDQPEQENLPSLTLADFGVRASPYFNDFEVGLQVYSVAPGSSAERAGIQSGDIILEAAQRKVAVVRDFEQIAIERVENGNVSLPLLLKKKSGEAFAVLDIYD